MPEQGWETPTQPPANQQPGQFQSTNGLPNNPGQYQQPSAKKPPVYKKWWFWVIIVVVVLGIYGAATGGDGQSNQPKPDDVAQSGDSGGKIDSDNEPDSSTDTADDSAVNNGSSPDQNTNTQAPDYSQVATVYTLTDGHYTAGVDIPAGTCNVIAVSGGGNLSSSNMYSGGINEIFGINDGSGFYTSEFNGLRLPKNTVLSVSGRLVIELTFTQIQSDYTGREQNEEAAVELASGNYVAGQDFEPGVYTIIAVSGHGNLSSSNMFNEGVNEVFGIDDGSNFYTESIQNVRLNKNTELKVSGGLVVKLIPSNPK